MQNQVIPSINCEDFSCIKERLKIAESIFVDSHASGARGQASAGLVHIDISDGKFTPHVSWNNPEELSDVMRQVPGVKAEVHLMIENPESQIDAWLKAGVNRVIIHLESMRDSVYILEKCKNYNAECFIAIKPETEAGRLLVYLDDFSGILILAVPPGPSGQKMKPEVLDKIKYLRENSPEVNIEIDGGVNLETANLAKKAGANLFVAGNFIFGNENRLEAYAALLRAVL